MSDSQDLFRKSLTGYDKKQVEKYFNTINTEEEAKIQELKEKIKETLMLNKELSDKMEEVKNYRELNGKTVDYKNFLMERLENISESMTRDAQNEIKELKEDARERELYLDDEISKLNRFFKNVQDNLDILIKTVLVKGEKESETEQDKNFRVIQYKGRANNKKMLQNDTEPEAEALPLAQNDIYRADNMDELKKMYILGKLAGEDLVDEAGEKIVNKDTIITEEIVKKAEYAGKLSELIIKMATPEIDK